MFKLNTIIRPNIAQLKPYSSARDEYKGEAAVFLDANENSLGSPLETHYNRYPDPLQMRLKTQLATLKNVKTEQIFLGNGSDEAIDLLFRAFCEPKKDNVILLPPTYGMYAVQGNIQGTELRYAALNTNFEPDFQSVFKQINEHTKIIFLCSPNNPTGNSLPTDFIEKILLNFHGLVVVDEAYIDFSEQISWTQSLDKFPNLVVLQTLSKAWGLAGLRIGIAIANVQIINVLNKIKYPYNLNDATIDLAKKALENVDKFKENLAILIEERKRLAANLLKLKIVEKVFPSDANFLLIKVKNANETYQFLAKNGIVVRNRTNEKNCENCLRITVGTAVENDTFIALLNRFDLNSKNPIFSENRIFRV
jgi:histidinol-phosphate aminotransferase